MTVLHPDPELVLKQWLLDNSAVSNLVDTRVSTSLPSNPSYPFVTVQLIGQTPDSSYVPMVSAMLQIDAYGRKKDWATPSEVVRTVWAEAFDARNFEVELDDGAKAHVYGFNLNMIRRISGETGEGRFIVDLEMIYRSA